MRLILAETTSYSLLMDEGLPIAYQVLDRGVPVMALGGEVIGTVDHVVAAEHEDIFHGIVMAGAGGPQFIAADQVASLHELGVDLNIDAAQAALLPAPHGGAPTFRVHEPGVKPSRWEHLLDRMGPSHGFKHNWSSEDSR
jgi:hypothetical protein